MEKFTELKTLILVGETVQDNKKSLQSFDLYVMTAQIFYNLQKDGTLKTSDFSCIIFDEVHKCKGEHVYVRLVKDYYNKSGSKLKPLLVGLTASIGTGKHREEILQNFSNATPLFPMKYKDELK